MASITAVSMATPTTKTMLSTLPVRLQRATHRPKAMAFKVQAVSLKEKAVCGMTGAVLTASMMVPDVAEAAELVPSLKNFIYSIVSGGIVLTAILGAVIAVSNFDPVKRA